MRRINLSTAEDLVEFERLMQQLADYEEMLQEIMPWFVHQPRGTYFECRHCHSYWWDKEKPRHERTCPIPKTEMILAKWAKEEKG